MTTVLAWTAISWVALAGVLVVCHYCAKRNLARQRAARFHVYIAYVPTRGLADWDQLHTAIDLARRDFTGATW